MVWDDYNINKKHGEENPHAFCMESVFWRFEAVPFEWGALGYRPDLFWVESPKPILASRVFERTFILRFPLIAKQSNMEGQGNSVPLWGMGQRPIVPRSLFPVPRALLRKLALVERRVEAALRQQRFVVALLDDVAVLHHQNHVRALDGG